MEITKRPVVVALLSALTSVGLHVYLAYQNYALKIGAAGSSMCDFTETFSCSAVALSDYAQFIGIPLAVWGASANLIFALFLIILLFGVSSNLARVARTTFWLSTLILGASVVMALISYFKMTNYCAYCIVAYVLSGVQFGAAFWLIGKSPLRHLGEDIFGVFSEQKWIAVLFILIPGVAWLGHSMGKDHFGFGQISRAINESLFDWNRAETVTFTNDGLLRDAPQGPAKMTIVEFGDYLCNHCKFAAPTLHNFVASRSDVTFVFKPYPLDGTCNTEIPSKGDGFRCKLAAIVLCSEKLKQKGWSVHDWIYEHQTEMKAASLPGHLDKIEAQFGVNKAELTTCIDSPETMDQVIKLAGEARGKIQGTPSFFVNGKKLDRAQFFPILDATYKQLSR